MVGVQENTTGQFKTNFSNGRAAKNWPECNATHIGSVTINAHLHWGEARPTRVEMKSKKAITMPVASGEGQARRMQIMIMMITTSSAAAIAITSPSRTSERARCLPPSWRKIVAFDSEA